jgi:hypothetical protein
MGENREKSQFVIGSMFSAKCVYYQYRYQFDTDAAECPSKYIV